MKKITWRYRYPCSCGGFKSKRESTRIWREGRGRWSHAPVSKSVSVERWSHHPSTPLPSVAEMGRVSLGLLIICGSSCRTFWEAEAHTNQPPTSNPWKKKIINFIKKKENKKIKKLTVYFLKRKRETSICLGHVVGQQL